MPTTPHNKRNSSAYRQGVGWEIAELAARQHGVVDRRQLYGLGCTRHQIGYWLTVGRLHAVHRGVYAIGQPSLTRAGLWKAAALAVGPGAVLSHWCAASLWGIARPSDRWPDVTVAGSRRQRKGMRIHCVEAMPGADRAVRDRIPVTSLPRTLLDLAAITGRRRLERLIEESERLRIFDLRHVDELLTCSRGRSGARALRAVLDDYRGSGFTRSELERRFLAVLRNAGLPAPSANLFVAGFEVDFLWDEERFIVEVDSWEFHRTRAAYERDRRRDELLALAGYQVTRVTELRLKRDSRSIPPDIRSHLARRRLELGLPARDWQARQ